MLATTRMGGSAATGFHPLGPKGLLPTCKGVTQRDFIFLSPEAAALVRRVVIQERFQEHASLHVGLQIPDHLPRYTLAGATRPPYHGRMWMSLPGMLKAYILLRTPTPLAGSALLLRLLKIPWTPAASQQRQGSQSCANYDLTYGTNSPSQQTRGGLASLLIRRNCCPSVVQAASKDSQPSPLNSGGLSCGHCGCLQTANLESSP